MNASMLAELKKKQSGENVLDSDAPAALGALPAGLPAFTPCRSSRVSSAGFTPCAPAAGSAPSLPAIGVSGENVFAAIAPGIYNNRNEPSPIASAPLDSSPLLERPKRPTRQPSKKRMGTSPAASPTVSHGLLNGRRGSAIAWGGAARAEADPRISLAT